jgi:hypothetical protein
MTIRMPARLTVAESLMLAMVASSDAPLLLLGADLEVIAISNSFGRTFHIQNSSEWTMAAGRPRGIDLERAYPSA